MNWYKIAKLIDKRAPTDASEATVACMYCGRWATHPEDEKAERDDYIWKLPEKLDDEEKIGAARSMDNYDVSSSICPWCWEILQEHKHMISPAKVKELSLELV